MGRYWFTVLGSRRISAAAARGCWWWLWFRKSNKKMNKAKNGKKKMINERCGGGDYDDDDEDNVGADRGEFYLLEIFRVSFEVWTFIPAFTRSHTLAYGLFHIFLFFFYCSTNTQTKNNSIRSNGSQYVHRTRGDTEHSHTGAFVRRNLSISITNRNFVNKIFYENTNRGNNGDHDRRTLNKFYALNGWLISTAQSIHQLNWTHTQKTKLIAKRMSE